MTARASQWSALAALVFAIVSFGCAPHPRQELVVSDASLFVPWWLAIEIYVPGPSVILPTPAAAAPEQTPRPDGTPSAGPTRVPSPGPGILASIPGAAFESESDTLTISLDSLVALIDCFTGPFEAAGHTDSEGDDAYNQDLSLRRAQTVVDELVRLGVASNRMAARGYGESQPRADETVGDRAEAQALNRRVELVGLAAQGCNLMLDGNS